jgi:hypothetical protein
MTGNMGVSTQANSQHSFLSTRNFINQTDRLATDTDSQDKLAKQTQLRYTNKQQTDTQDEQADLHKTR